MPYDREAAERRRLHRPDIAPVLIMGTHRSGTSVIANSLRACGLFTGARRDSNGESTFFQRLNRRLTQEAGGHWTTPRSVYEALRSIENLESFAAPLHAHLTSVGAVEFWGVRAAFRGPPEQPWGWKDPRNGALLPLWIALYPDLKVLWVRRDPRPSAISLVARTTKLRHNIDAQSRQFDPRSQWRRVEASQRGRPLLADGWRSLSLEAALELTIASGELHAEVVQGLTNKVHTVDYEDLLADPRRVLEDAARFADLAPNPALIRTAAATIITPTGVQPNPQLDDLSRQHAARLTQLGYS